VRGREAHVRFPVVTDPAAAALRPQWHVPNSIATVHCAMVVAIARMLPRCPCCARTKQATKFSQDAVIHGGAGSITAESSQSTINRPRRHPYLDWNFSSYALARFGRPLKLSRLQ
jgi:hypothetical protein